MDFYSGFDKPLSGGTTKTAPQKKGGVGGFLGGLVDSVVSPAAKFINQGVNEAGGAYDTARMIAANSSGNTKAAKNANTAANNRYKKYGDTGGLFNKGTITNEKETRKGDFATGAKKIGGTTLELEANLFPGGEGEGIGAKALNFAKAGALAGGGESLAKGESLNQAAEGALKGGAIGGVTGGVLGAGEGILNKLTGGIGSIADKSVAKTAERTAAKDALEKTAQSVEEEAPYAAINTTGRQRGTMRSTLDFFKSLKMGTDPKALKAGADLVTGENGVVSGTMRKLLGDTGKVPTNDVMDRTRAALVKEAGQLGDVETRGSHANGVLRSIRDTLQGTAYKGEGNLSKTGGADANDVFDALKNVETRIQELGENGADAAEKRALKATKGALEDSIYKNGKLDKVVSQYKLAPDDIAAIHDAAIKSGVSADAAQHVIDGINNATSGKELRSLQAPFVRASQLAGSADRAGEGVLTKLPKQAGEGEGMFGGRGGFYKALELGRLAHGDPTALLPLVASAGEKGPNIAQKAVEGVVNKGRAVADAVPKNAGNFLDRLVRQGAVGQIEQEPQSGTTDTQAPNTSSSSVPEVDTTSAEPYNPFAPENVQTSVNKILSQGGKMKDVADYLSIAESVNKLTGNSLTPAQQKSQAASKNAGSALSTIEKSFNAAGGGQGKVKGFLNNLLGKTGLNSEVATYNDTATSLGAQIYKALGNTGTISDKDRQAIASLIPKTTDTDNTAKAKIAQLQDLLQQAQDSASN